MAQMLGTRSVIERLAQLLLNLGDLYGRPDNGTILIRRRITHDEIAALVGSTRQWVTMMLKRFQREGILSVDHTHIRLTRPGRLHEIVQTEGEDGGRSSGFRPGVEAAMLQVADLVPAGEFHDTRPEPRRSAVALRAHHHAAPLGADGPTQLPSMSPAHDMGEIMGRLHRLLAAELIDIELEILRQQFAHDDGLAEDMHRQHPLAEIGGERPRPGHDPFRRVFGIRAPVGRRRGGVNRLFQIDQGEPALVLLAVDPHQGRVAQIAEGAAPLHPVSGIDQAHPRPLAAPVEGEHEITHPILTEEVVEGGALLPRRAPRSAARAGSRARHP